MTVDHYELFDSMIQLPAFIALWIGGWIANRDIFSPVGREVATKLTAVVKDALEPTYLRALPGSF